MGTLTKLLIVAIFIFHPLDTQAQNEDLPVIKNSTSEVILYPIVTDSEGRHIMVLEAENFKISEDGVKQEVTSFRKDNVPASIGIIFDISGSTQGIENLIRSALNILGSIRHPNDEFFVILVGTAINLRQDFTTDFNEIQNSTFIKIGGQTALLDGIYMGINKLGKGRHSKKALFIFSDGQDNNSSYTEKEVQNALNESDVRVYAFWIYNGQEIQYQRVPSTRVGEPDTYKPIIDPGYVLLENLAYESGGVINRDGAYKDQLDESQFNQVNMSFEAQFIKIALGLRMSYVISYESSNTTKKGLRKIKIELIKLPKGYSGLRVRARRSYQIR